MFKRDFFHEIQDKRRFFLYFSCSAIRAEGLQRMFCQSKDGSANGTFVISRFKRTGFLQQKERTPEGKKNSF